MWRELIRGDFFHVSANSLSLLGHPAAQPYLDRINQFICNESPNFLMRRLFILNNQEQIDWMLELYEQYQNNRNQYLMRAIETQIDTCQAPMHITFFGYIIIDKRYSFLIFPRSTGASIKNVFIESESASEILLERYDELWSLANEVNDEYLHQFSDD